VSFTVFDRAEELFFGSAVHAVNLAFVTQEAT
jgi:hypothetical protein